MTGRPKGDLASLVATDRHPDEPGANLETLPPIIAHLRDPKMAAQIAAALPPGITFERFNRVCQTLFMEKPKLLLVHPKSMMAALFKCAQLGLEPNTPLGHCYLVPFNARQADGPPVVKLNFMMGYKGLVNLAYRSPRIETIEVNVVHEHDEFDYSEGTNKFLHHKRRLRDRGEPLCYYGVVHITGARKPIFEIVDLDTIEAHKYASMSARDGEGPWITWPIPMGKKTVLRIMAPYLPLEVDAADAVALDEKAIIDDTTVEYIDASASEAEASSGFEQHIEATETGNNRPEPEPEAEPAQ